MKVFLMMILKFQPFQLQHFYICGNNCINCRNGNNNRKDRSIRLGKDFSGTNKVVYRSLDVTTNQLYLRVDDTNALYAAVYP